MTGWRIGWLIFPSGMSTIFDNLSQYNTTSVATFIQHAAIKALDQGDDFIKALVARSAKGREIICSALDSLPNVQVFWPEGTFYFFFSVRGMNSAYDMARRILREASVGVAPGSAFGQGGEAYLRVCFAVDPTLIQEGADRLVGFLEKAG
jgi:aspartate/methionine/tyrosine aminotransferase